MATDRCNIIENRQLANKVFKLVLEADTSRIVRAGQFVNISIDKFYLRRPISVCDYDKTTITLIYKVVGEGTEALSKYKNGDELDILLGLGNGFDTDIECTKPLLIGGGVGVPPLYNLAKRLSNEGKQTSVILCFNTKNEIFLLEEFKSLNADIYVATVDGSYGSKGFFDDVITQKKIDFDYYYTCGPLPMLRSVHEKINTKGQISFEERMGCGFGGCMGCSHKTKNGYKRVCTDTIINSDEVIFD